MKKMDLMDVDLVKKLSLRFSSRIYKNIKSCLNNKLSNTDWSIENHEFLYDENFKLKAKKQIAGAIFKYMLNEDFEGSFSLKREAILNRMVEFESDIYFYKNKYKDFCNIKDNKILEIEKFYDKELKNSSTTNDHVILRFKRKAIRENKKTALENIKIEISPNIVLSFINHHLHNIITKSKLDLNAINEISIDYLNNQDLKDKKQQSEETERSVMLPQKIKANP